MEEKAIALFLCNFVDKSFMSKKLYLFIFFFNITLLFIDLHFYIPM